MPEVPVRRLLCSRPSLHVAIGIASVLTLQPLLILAQTANDTAPNLETGQEIWQAACSACHGADGRGAPRTQVSFQTRLPDFTDCSFATRDPDVDWQSVITNGGPARGFSRIMPAFGDALTEQQIGKLIDYMRAFCRDKAWPKGDLNLPRALYTEKAFPESETIITTAFNGQGAPAVSNQITYEQRFTANDQLEFNAPVSFLHKDTGTWVGGIGDITLGYKRKVFHTMKGGGSILSAIGEVNMPTGNVDKGTGAGTTIFETSALFDQILPANGFLELQTGVELPTHTDKAPRAFFMRTALGRSFSTDKGLGRAWSPMVEFIADRDLETGAKTNWDIVPQMQIPLSKRMHILGDIGVRVPMNNTAGRPIQVVFYLLWDWADGGLLKGW